MDDMPKSEARKASISMKYFLIARTFSKACSNQNVDE